MPTFQTVGRRGASSLIAFEVSAKDIARITKKLESVKHMPMRARVEKALFAEADILASKVKSAAPRRTGVLRRSVSVHRARRGIFASAFETSIGDILVGPRAPYRHLVIRGHRIVTPGGRFTGRRTAANPFVDRAASRSRADIQRAVERAWFQTL